MELIELIGELEGLRLERGRDAGIGGISYHSARVKPGDLFVAVKGLRTDGHNYLEEAVSRGAAGLVVREGAVLPAGRGEVAVVRAADTRKALALLSDRFWEHPSGYLDLVGVTGTNGKTTTSHLVEWAATGAGIPSALIGTVVYRIAGEDMKVERTTPESADLQELLARMVNAGCRVASMEVSSHALVLSRVLGCDFKVAVFTNLSQDHLDFHRDMEDYFTAKANLFRDTESGGMGAARAVINVDDAYGRRLAGMAAGEVLSFGTSPDAELRGEILRAGLRHMRLAVSYGNWRQEGETALTGSFNLYNILAALGACIALGLDERQALEDILAHPGVPGRFQPVAEGQEFAVIVDYAHTPDSLRRVLESAREIAGGRVLAVFGCGGDRDREKRPLMGEVAVSIADKVYITSDNPRSEDPIAIIDQIEEGVLSSTVRHEYVKIGDRRSAIETAIAEALPGDVVVIAGKGHEKGQIFADRILPFDDVREARSFLRRRLEER